MSFNVQTEGFQGPLELLLELVERRKLYVSDVSLAKVADDYVHHIESQEHLPLAATAQFLVVASTLLLIKSRSLLPNLELTEEEETDIRELQKRLQLYQKAKEGSALLRKLLAHAPMIAPRRTQPTPRMFIKSTDLSLVALTSAVKNVINEFPTFITKPEISVEKVLSLPEMIDTLSERIRRAVHTNFNAVAQKGAKADLIVSFLALLELVRQGMVDVRQEAKFADIDIQTEGVAVPSY